VSFYIKCTTRVECITIVHMTNLALDVADLIKDYSSYRAVDGISFSVEKGQVLGLLGPNGAGKTTTIQMLLGITLPTAGSIKYFGHDFAENKQACLQRINFASAYTSLQKRITVIENLRVFAGLYGTSRPKLKIAELLDYFQVSYTGNVKFGDLSSGEKTRVILAKSLLNDPELLLMDEPTASLDPDIADKVLSLIEKLREDQQITILATSHNMAEVERICDEVIFLEKGKVISRDTPANYIKKIDIAEVRLYFKSAASIIKPILHKFADSFDFTANDQVVLKLHVPQIARFLAEVHRSGIEITDIDVHKPTLDNVFIDMARRDTNND
jgi:ABC-2 type transport system ATP-binding protein